MKARPRFAENKVASILSDFYESVGTSRIDRIPVIGRTGPDMRWNELMLLVDVKSRACTPKAYLPIHRVTDFHDGTIGIPIAQLDFSYVSNGGVPHASARVRSWLDHMDEWRKDNVPDGISMLVLHRPKMPYGECTCVIYRSDVERFYERREHYRTLQYQYQLRLESALESVG